MIDLGTLKLGIEVDNGEANKQLDASKEKVSNLSKVGDMAKKGAIAVGKGIATAVGVASTAVTALAGIGVNYNMQMETYTTNFETMLGSQEDAVKKVAELKKFASSTPLAMDDLAKGTQTLLAFGVENDKTTAKLQQLGDISLGNAEKMQSLATAYGKATAQGKLTGETVQSMIDAGFNPLIQISKTAGETMEETQKRMSAGQISVEELDNALQAVTSTGGQFAGGMAKASHTTKGLISTLSDNAKSLVGEVFEPLSQSLLGDLLPTALSSLDTMTTAFREKGVTGLIESAGEMIPAFITKILEQVPKLLGTASQLVQALLNGIQANLPFIMSAGIKIITMLTTTIVSMLPQILEMGIQMLVSLINGIAESLPELIPVVIDAVLTMVDTILDNIDMIIDAGINMIMALADGLIKALPQLIDRIPIIIEKLINAFANNYPKMVETGINLIIQLAFGIIKAIPNIIKCLPQIIVAIVKGIGNLASNMWEAGKNLVKELWNGIKSMGKWIGDKVSGFFKGLFGKDKTKVAVEAEYSESKTEQKKFATGGILTKATTFGFMGGTQLIGGEAGTEAVIPLKELPSLMAKMGYIKPSAINTSISIDGREFAIATSPYISEELAFA